MRRKRKAKNTICHHQKPIVQILHELPHQPSSPHPKNKRRRSQKGIRVDLRVLRKKRWRMPRHLRIKPQTYGANHDLTEDRDNEHRAQPRSDGGAKRRKGLAMRKFKSRGNGTQSKIKQGERKSRLPHSPHETHTQVRHPKIKEMTPLIPYKVRRQLEHCFVSRLSTVSFPLEISRSKPSLTFLICQS